MKVIWHNGMCDMTWHDHHNRITLTSITTHRQFRRMGLADSLLHRLCEYADTRKISISLVVMPYDSTERCMNHDQLYAWYGSYGFHRVDDDGKMTREPMRERVDPVIMWQPIS